MTAQLARPNLAGMEADIAAWGLPTTEDRLAKRLKSSMHEIRRFYDAMLPRLPEVIEYLNQFPLQSIPEQDQPMARAALAMCEIDNAVNKWGVAVVDTGIDVRKFIPKTRFADRSTA